MLSEKSKKRKTHMAHCYVIYKFCIRNILTSLFLLSLVHLQVPCDLKDNLKCLRFSEKEVNKQIKMLQIKSITGSVKIVKSFLKFKCWSDCVSNFIYNGWPIFTSFLVITFSFTACAMFESIHPSLVSSSLSQGCSLYLILIWSSRWTLI